MQRKRPNLIGLGSRVAQSAAAKQEHPVDEFLTDHGLIHLPVDALRPNPNQPRKYFDQSAHQELTASVREKGILQPVIARRDSGNAYILVSGERRWRAAKDAGLSKIPAIIRGDDDALEVAVIENVQREDLHPLELARGLLELKNEHNYTDDALAKIIGKSRQYISESLLLNQLPEPIKAECHARGIGSKSQLLQILRAGSPEKVETAWNVVKNGEVTTTRQLEKRIRTAKGRPKNYQFHYKPTHRRFRVTVAFSKPTATTREIKQALHHAMESLT